MASNIYQMTVNKITYEISMGNDVEKYRTIVNNYYRVKQITLAERDSLLELIDNAYVVEEPEEPEEPEVPAHAVPVFSSVVHSVSPPKYSWLFSEFSPLLIDICVYFLKNSLVFELTA